MTAAGAEAPNYLLPESILFITPSIYDGKPSFVFQLCDNTHVVYPTPTEADAQLMWKNICNSVRNNFDFILFLDCFVNIRYLKSADVDMNESVSEFRIIFQFPNDLQFIRTYTDEARMREDHARFIEVWEMLKSFEIPETPKSLLN